MDFQTQRNRWVILSTPACAGRVIEVAMSDAIGQAECGSGSGRECWFVERCRDTYNFMDFGTGSG